MSYLLDTNIISELKCNKPNSQVQHWFSIIPTEALFLSVLTLGEIRKGIEKLEQGSKRNDLNVWLEYNLVEWFGDRILNIDEAVAERWGYLTANVVKPLPAIDGLLAATALTHNLKMVTRNVKDFDLPGLEVINPFH
jgi:predicted nucleic acid-binding protein